jgi:hypothetical protein
MTEAKFKKKKKKSSTRSTSCDHMGKKVERVSYLLSTEKQCVYVFVVFLSHLAAVIFQDGSSNKNQFLFFFSNLNLNYLLLKKSLEKKKKKKEKVTRHTLTRQRLCVCLRATWPWRPEHHRDFLKTK